MKTWLLTLALLLPAFGIAQDASNYPQHYFRNPLDFPILLAGNFGECRPGHFHSGIDIKTNGKENAPVHAAADGYISRIKMDKTGFGHALYVTHPNGYTTLYAHLNDFAPAIQRYVHEQQYAQQHWDIDVQLPPTMFPVKKGQLIAYSGNTGSSTAPHVHFEIRNTKTEHPLNPELFGLPIVDHIAPVPTEVVLYDLSRSIYDQKAASNNRPLSVPLAKKPKDLFLLKDRMAEKDHLGSAVKDDTIFTELAKIGIGLNVNDFMNNSDNTLAFYDVKVVMDDSIQVEIKLDNIGYEVTRYVNAYADYETKWRNGKWIQCLFKLPGNHLDDIYTSLNRDAGALDIGDGKKHKVQMDITDAVGNRSSVVMYLANKALSVPDDHLPVGVSASRTLMANTTNVIDSSFCSFTLDDKQLYDNIMDFPIQRTSAGCVVGSAEYPVDHYFELKLKPNTLMPIPLRSKICMRYTDGKDTDGRKAAPVEDGWYTAKVRAFGAYWLQADTTAPVINFLGNTGVTMSKGKELAFKVTDDLTSVKRYAGYIDGKWVCFEQHNDLFFYKFDDHCGKGKHTLVFKAYDENDNERTYTRNFTR
jgi:Peptidase family M23